jgi:probable rRNA maturation factor
MAISFQNQDIVFTLKEKIKTRNWIKQIIAAEKKKPGSLSFVFTSDAALLEVNKQFLNHTTYTDIITFDYCEREVVNGDILISVERVKENAKKFGVTPVGELKRVMIHGVLHLCGYKDKSKADAALMRKKEDWALEKFGN